MKRTGVIITALVLTATACASDGEQSSVPDNSDAAATTPATDPSDAVPGETDPNDADQTSSSAPSENSPTTPDQESPTTVSTTPPPVVQPLYEVGDIDTGLQPFIDQAIDDLAARLDVDASTITTRSAVLVTWPDASIGCPQPDMQYAQVLTDGSVIELEQDGDVYRYHTGGQSGPFICEQPITKAPPTELLTLDDFDN